jgi:lambda family phage portal protein
MAIKTDTPIGGLADPDGRSGTDSVGNREKMLEPGMIMELAPGEDVVGINPGRPNTGAETWIKLILRGIAVGTGLSYETVARDYSQTSYSSSRTSQLEDRRRFRCWQQYLIRHFLQPVWDEFFTSAALSGVDGFPSSAELLDNRRGVAPVEWQTPEWEWVDPQSEQQASESALNSFTDTYANVLGARGLSYRSVFYQRAKENRLMEKLGLQTAEQKQLAISAAQTPGATTQVQTGSGEMMGLSTLQFNRNRKAIAKTLDDLASGAISEAAARVFLSSIGMSETNVQALIDDSKDGSIDTLPAEQA